MERENLIDRMDSLRESEKVDAAEMEQLRSKLVSKIHTLAGHMTHC